MNNINIKKKKSQQKIEKIFIELLQKKEIQDISVSDICKLAKLNRSTFYYFLKNLLINNEHGKFQEEMHLAHLF